MQESCRYILKGDKYLIIVAVSNFVDYLMIGLIDWQQLFVAIIASTMIDLDFNSWGYIYVLEIDLKTQLIMLKYGFFVY